MWKCISNLTVDPLTVDCWSSPPESTVNSVDHWSPHCWPLTLSLLIVDHLAVDHWPSHCWSSPSPQNQQSAVLIIDHFTVDHWPSLLTGWLSIASLLTINPLTVDCWSLITSLLTVNPLTIDCWSSITSLLTVEPLTVDCWSSPPESTVNSVDHESPDCWPLTLSLLTVDRQSPHCWLLTLSLLTVDPPHVHFVENNEISVPPRHSVRSTGWPLVQFTMLNRALIPQRIRDFYGYLVCIRYVT